MHLTEQESLVLSRYAQEIQQEGQELVHRLRASFYMISAEVSGWGDRDVLD